MTNESPGVLASCCNRRHQLLHTALQCPPVCAITECTRPVDEQAAIVHDSCGITHARLAATWGETTFSRGRPAATAGAEAYAPSPDVTENRSNAACSAAAHTHTPTSQRRLWHSQRLFHRTCHRSPSGALSPRATRLYTPTIAPATRLPVAVSAINSFISLCFAQRIPRRTQHSQIRRLPPVRQRRRQQSAYAPSRRAIIQPSASSTLALATWRSAAATATTTPVRRRSFEYTALQPSRMLNASTHHHRHKHCSRILLLRVRARAARQRPRRSLLLTGPPHHPRRHQCMRPPRMLPKACRLQHILRMHARLRPHTGRPRPSSAPTPPPSPPQSPRPSAADWTDTRPAYPRPVTVTARFFSDVWHMSHAAWNKLQHALHENGAPRPTQQPGDPPRPPPASQPTTAVTAPRHSHVDTFLQQLMAVARLLAAQGGAPRCALPGCTNLVHVDDANPQRRNDYCSRNHAFRASAARSADPSPSARPSRKTPAKPFVLTQTMRACSVRSQRHLDRDCSNRPPPSSATVSSPPGQRPPRQRL